jgi:hypothetical protein
MRETRFSDYREGSSGNSVASATVAVKSLVQLVDG